MINSITFIGPKIRKRFIQEVRVVPKVGEKIKLVRNIDESGIWQKEYVLQERKWIFTNEDSHVATHVELYLEEIEINETEEG